MHGEVLAFAAQRFAHFFHHVEGNGADARPGHIGQQAKCAIEVQGARLGESVRQQVQSQVHVGGILRSNRSVDFGDNSNDLHTTARIVGGRRQRVALLRRTRICPTKMAVVRVEHDPSR